MVKNHDCEVEGDTAATVTLLRDTKEGVQVLMVRKNRETSFGGLWVFPGGRVEPGDHAGERDLESAARRAAVREASEEAGLVLQPDSLVWFSHWTPPAEAPHRYFTWFFAAQAGPSVDVQVDGHEIEAHAWIAPEDALRFHAEGRIKLVAPTWVTLRTLAQSSTAAGLLERLRSVPAFAYETRMVQRADGVRVALWAGDAGYEALEVDAVGGRHRLVMSSSGYRFESS